MVFLLKLELENQLCYQNKAEEERYKTQNRKDLVLGDVGGHVVRSIWSNSSILISKRTHFGRRNYTVFAICEGKRKSIGGLNLLFHFWQDAKSRIPTSLLHTI